MARNRWHITHDEQAVTVSRHLPARFDVSAETVIGQGSRLRVAQQVRQDMWRRLQRVRGFSPVVRVVEREDGLHVTAGGRCAGRFPQDAVKAEIDALLADPKLRLRWRNYATVGRGAQNG